MCRNIRILFNFEPPVTEDEVRAASLQFVRKVSGFNKPSKANEAAFQSAVDEITAIATKLLGSLQTSHRRESGRRSVQSAGARGVTILQEPPCPSRSHMRSAIIIFAGLGVLGVFAFVGWTLGGATAAIAAAQIFIAFWFIAALVNMWIGIVRAGYSIAEEFPIFLPIFAIPAAVAALVWWKLS